MKTFERIAARLKPLRRVFAVAFMLFYITAGGCCLYWHLIGDNGRFAWAYFGTWDMFPNYPAFSARRTAVAQTRSGQYLEIVPNDSMRFRRGGQGDLTRFDLPRSDATLRQVVAAEFQAHPPTHTEDPVTYVFLIENYWPVRFNLPDDLYRAGFQEENPHRDAWRIIDEGTVEPDGNIRWTSAP